MYCVACREYKDWEPDQIHYLEDPKCRLHVKETNMTNHEPFEHEEYKGSDWLGMFFATIAGLIVAIMIIGTLMATFDALTGWELHEMLAELTT